MENSRDALQHAVGGYIEVVKLGDRRDLIVNEDGVKCTNSVLELVAGE